MKMPPSARRIKNSSINQDIADDIKIAMACMNMPTNNISNNSSERLFPSAITSYSVCDQTFVALSSSDFTINDYNNQVLFVIVDLYNEDCSRPNCAQCVICKDNFFIPKITKCGHIFCYSCIMGYMVACGSTQLVKCPLCSRWIHAPELKSLIWRTVDKLKVGDKIKFHLYRYNTETNLVERMRENLDKTTARRKPVSNQQPSRHTFEYLWNHVKHKGNGQLYVDQTEHNLILPDNNIYFISKDQPNFTLFDIEKTILVDQISNTSISAEELMSYLACNDHFNDFIDRLSKQFQSYAEENLNVLNSSYSLSYKSPNDMIVNDNRSSAKTCIITSKKVNATCSDRVANANNKDNNQSKNKDVSTIPIFPFVKPEFIKTPRDFKNRQKPTDENCYRFKKYLFFYKNEVYFNTYMSSTNCNQIVNHLMQDICIFDSHLHLPIKVEGVLLQVENYDPVSALLADSCWKYCSSMVKFVGFCNLQLIYPYQLEIPQMSALQCKYSTKHSRPNHITPNNTTLVTGDDNMQNSVDDPFQNSSPPQFPSSAINNSAPLDTLSGVYPDLMSYHYDYFGNKNDDFPSFD